MAFASNPGFLAVAFIEGSAAFILLVLYWLLAKGFPGRFFRYWMAGWTIYLAVSAMRIFSLWRGGPDNPRFSAPLALAAAALFLAAILDRTGERRRLRLLWPAGVIAAAGFAALAFIAQRPDATRWGMALLECFLYLSAGWVLWRSHLRFRRLGWELLAGALVLRGLHGLDQADWLFQTYGLFRVSFQGLFGIAMGIGMAVLVLEEGRARNEDFNEKLRRLALITAEATQSFRVRDALEGALRHVVESLNASHGLVYLFSAAADSKSLLLGASVGFSGEFQTNFAAISTAEPWVQHILRREQPIVSTPAPGDSAIGKWMQSERLSAIVMVRVPGKDTPLGFLGIGSDAPRSFEEDERHFLANVANLLGLTIQNVELFENAATSRRQWLDTFDSIGDLILVHAPDGRILRANRSLAVHLKTDTIALAGRYVRELLHQGSTQWTRCPYCEGAAGKADEIDPTFGGYFLATDSDFHDSAGECLGTIHVLKDFTSSRNAENKFRLLFEKVQEGVFISTPEGRFLDFNEAFLRMMGYENRDELLAVDISSALYVDPADRQRLKRLLHEYGEVTDFEFQFRRRDQEIRTAHESSFTTRDESGAIVAYQGFLLDITERKQAEMEIRRRNRELLALSAIAELLSQSSPLEELLTRALSKITEVFGAEIAVIHLLDQPTGALKQFAVAGHESELAHKPSAAEFPSALLQQIRQVRALVLSGSAPVLPEGLKQLQRAEEILSSQVVVLWAKDRILGTLLIGCREIREFSTAELNLLAAVGNQIAATIDKSRLLEETREAYESLRRAQEQLLQSEKMAAVGQLISGVAHELNNPLTAILGYTQLLQSEETLAARAGDFVEKLRKQAQRTHRIVQNLLSFARQHKPERSAVQLNQIIEDTLTLREYDLRVKKIRIHREFDSRLPATTGDFHQLQQVFLNILNNAVDAISDAAAEGEIWIRTSADASFLRVECTDSGPGLQNPHRVFDPFYTTKPVGKGTGLGLSICYGIVKEHGGEILAQNSPPRGATFVITLPMLPVSAIHRPQAVAGAPAVASGSVLLLDDEDAVLQLEKEILASRGVRVVAARTLPEAAAALQKQSFDAIVADVGVASAEHPGGASKWIERNLSGLRAKTLLTISTGGDWNAEGHPLASWPCIRKPFDVDVFWAAVRKALRAEAPDPAPALVRR